MKLLCAVCLAALFAALFCSPHILPEEADPPASAAVIAEFDAAGDSEKLFVIQNDPIYPARLVRFAEDYPQAIDYVYHYPARKDTFDETPLFAEAASDAPPLLFQWDARWGYASYGDGLIGCTGCGPTVLSMAALALVGDPAYTPLFVARLADENGYYVSNVGSSWALIGTGCELLGLSAREVPLSQDAMRQALDDGDLLAAVVGPGDFTKSGHFLLIRDFSDEGFILNDPNSAENSARLWPFDVLMPQIKNIWALSAGKSN